MQVLFRQGDGINCSGVAKPTFKRCRIERNLGGGPRCDHSSPLLIDCCIAGHGVGIYSRGSHLHLESCTVLENSESNFFAEAGSPGIIKNSIVPGKMMVGSSLLPEVSYS